MIYGGIDVGGTTIKLGFVDGQGAILGKSTLPVHRLTTYEDFLMEVSQALLSLCNDHGNFEWSAAGMGCPGRIDVDAGRHVWLKDKLEYLVGHSLAADLEAKLGKPVHIDNDVNSIVLGEHMFGAGKGYRFVVGFALGTGIGGAVIVDNKLVRGRNWATGHFGYMSQNSEGDSHYSGNRGAVEGLASHSGMLYHVNKRLKAGRKSTLQQITQEKGAEFGVRDIFTEAENRDGLAVELVNLMEQEVAVLIANLVVAFDPELVLIGGGIMSAGEEFYQRIVQAAKARVGMLPNECIEIKQMKLGADAGIYGGAALAVEKLSKRIDSNR
jgi:glucokinase